MYKRTRNSLAFLIFLFVLILPMTAIAQTTGSVRGNLHTPDGVPVIGAIVTVTDTRSGTVRVVRSNDNGVFSARDLIVVVLTRST